MKLFKSFRRRRDAETKGAVKNSPRVKLIDTSGRPQQGSPAYETRVTKKYSSPKPVVEKPHQETRSPVQSILGLKPKKKTTKVFVACPEGLDEGNTMIVISPDETQKFPVRVPKGVRPFEVFAVDLPKKEEEVEENEIRQGSSFDSWCGAVDQCLDPTPRSAPITSEGNKQDADAKTEPESEPESFGAALDDFFTPTPEVKAVYRQDLS
mmetsp:Transcript_4474/g.9320  ORF Transcript_4474/g.9320 Transcript_4474/m.9320 type:complete len:209 (-) Transcript_4474:182-808(-)|eukprot:scaffold19096_cov149-Amphora_coffeaeformis.AAC.1